MTPDDVAVGRHASVDERRTESPARLDHHRVASAAGRVFRKRHAGDLGRHHQLNDDGHPHRIVDPASGCDSCCASSLQTDSQQSMTRCSRSARVDVVIGCVLTRKTGARAVFTDGRAADDTDLGARSSSVGSAANASWTSRASSVSSGTVRRRASVAASGVRRARSRCGRRGRGQCARSVRRTLACDDDESGGNVVLAASAPSVAAFAPTLSAPRSAAAMSATM